MFKSNLAFKNKIFILIAMSSIPFANAQRSCPEKREALRERLKQCQTPECKQRIRKEIQDLNCNETNERPTNKEVSDTTTDDCRHLVKLWEKDEPLRREGDPDTTNKIEGNVAYREQPKGLNAYVQNSKNNDYELIKNLKGVKAGAFTGDGPFPQVGAQLPNWSTGSTNKPQQSKAANVGFQPHRATWVDKVSSEQDEL